VSPEKIVAKLFPSITRDSKEFASKTRQVKKALPPYLRNAKWRRKDLWESETLLDPGLVMQLSVPDKGGQKIIGGRNAPCQCVIKSQGRMEVQVYERHWKGWLAQQLANLGWPEETAQKHVLYLRPRSKTSELNIDLMRAVKFFKEMNVRDSENKVGLKIQRKKLIVAFSPRLTELLQNLRDKDDEGLKKLRLPVSSQVVLASVSTLHTERLFQGLGLSPQQVKQASDTLVSVGVEDQPPDFVYLVYGPSSPKPRQKGIRALITPLASYEVQLAHR
jgi:hypothetical protein